MFRFVSHSLFSDRIGHTSLVKLIATHLQYFSLILSLYYPPDPNTRKVSYTYSIDYSIRMVEILQIFLDGFINKQSIYPRTLHKACNRTVKSSNPLLGEWKVSRAGGEADNSFTELKGSRFTHGQTNVCPLVENHGIYFWKEFLVYLFKTSRAKRPRTYWRMGWKRTRSFFYILTDISWVLFVIYSSVESDIP